MKLLNAIRIFWFVLTSKNNYRLKDNDIAVGNTTFTELRELAVLYFAGFAKMCNRYNMKVEVSNRNKYATNCNTTGEIFIVNIKLRSGIISHYFNKKYYYLYSSLPYTDAPKFSNEDNTKKDIAKALTEFIKF